MGQLYSILAPQPQPRELGQPPVRSLTVKTQTYFCVPKEGGQPYSFLKTPPRKLEPREGGGLCSICLSLGQLPSECWDSINNFRDVVVQHHRTFSTFLRSAHGGCHFCGLLLIALEQNCCLLKDSNGPWVGKSGFESATLDGWINLKFRRERKLLPVTGVQVDEVQISILCGNMLSEMGGQLICYPVNAGFQALPEACIPSMSDTNTGSSASISRMQAWLDTCTSSHPACNWGDTLPPPLPTRVIAVGGKQSNRSFLVSGADRRGNYATLSHCWGNPNNRPLTTTDQTLTLRQQGIKDEELPKTFQDAVRVCRQLGIEFLWIDSLCIIQEQGSQEDWAEEAPKMGDVYGNSTLAIAAAVAADSTEGCFRERLGLIFWPCPILLFGQQCHVSRYPTKDEESSGDPGDLNPSPRYPLSSRAWVLQEQILPRRSLIFTSNRLVWRCASMSTNEKYPLGMPHAPNISTDNHRLLHCIVNDVIAVEPVESDIDIYTCWYRMIMEVTSRKLTYEDDKLPAIAGIAKRFAAKSKDSYRAGLWRGDLLVGLLWMSTTLTPGETTRAARAPSWSWASVNSPVSYSSLLSAGCDAIHIPMSPLLDILDVSDPPTCAKHPFGMTSKASLQLSGALLPVVKDEHEDSGLALVGHGPRYAEDIENFCPDHWGLDPCEETPWYCLPVLVRHDPYVRGIRGDPEPYKASWKESLKTGFDEFRRFNIVFCLVLQAVREQHDTYSRVGVCVINTRKGTEISRISFRERRTLTII